MTVKTLTGNEFSRACETLAEKVLKSYQPDLIVGILTGGGFVGKEIFKTINPENENSHIVYTEIRIQRPDTKKKDSGWRKLILKYSPVFVLDWLRMTESLFLEYKARRNIPQRKGNIVFDEKIDAWLRCGNKKVLLVDDAIDTGTTLLLVKNYMKEHYREVEIRTAAITVTMPNPLVDADYCLFHNRTLVRFPWSNDIKK